MKKISYILVSTLLLSACVTGESVKNLRSGMSKDQVISTIGNPDGYYFEDGYEVFQYRNRLMSGWSWNRADYYAKFMNDRLVAWDTNKIREHASPFAPSLNIYKSTNQN